MTPPWLTIAVQELMNGVREDVSRHAHHPRIVAYHATTTLKATDDETPWCSSFVNWCIERAGLVGTKSAAARSWITWGQDASDEREDGQIVVLSRQGGHHVGFLVTETDDMVLLLGGNQGNRVSVAPFAKQRVLARRWPT